MLSTLWFILATLFTSFQKVLNQISLVGYVYKYSYTITDWIFEPPYIDMVELVPLPTQY